MGFLAHSRAYSRRIRWNYWFHLLREDGGIRSSDSSSSLQIAHRTRQLCWNVFARCRGEYFFLALPLKNLQSDIEQLWCALYYLPLYYEGVKGYSPIIAGVAVFPQTFTVAPASVVVGIVVTLTGRFRWALWVGWSLSVAGLGLVSMLGPDTTVVQWVFLNFVSGLGLGMLFPAMGFAIQAAAEERDAAYAVAMFSFFRAFGQAFGVAIGGVIFQNAFLRELKKYPGLEEVAGEYARDAVSLVQSLKRMPGGIEKTMLKQAYSDGLRIVWLSMIGFTAAALLLSLLTEPLSLDRALESEQQIRDKKKVTDEETKPEKK